MDEKHTRRHILKSTGLTLTTVVAGCSTSENNSDSNGSDATGVPTSTRSRSGSTATRRNTATETEGRPTETDPTETPDDSTPTETPDDSTPTPEPEPERKDFETIYNEDYASHNVLSSSDIDQIQSTDYETIHHKLEDVNNIIDDAYQIQRGGLDDFRSAVHDDLGLSTDQVKIFQSDKNGENDFLTVLAKEKDGNWTKALGAGTTDKGSYLRPDENTDLTTTEQNLKDPFNKDNLGYLSWMIDQVKEGIKQSREAGASESTIEDYVEDVKLDNDKIVVGQDSNINDITYEGEEVTDYMSDLFGIDRGVNNKEHEFRVNATEVYHSFIEDNMVIGVKSGRLADNEYELTTADDGTKLYAEEVNDEEFENYVNSLMPGL